MATTENLCATILNLWIAGRPSSSIDLRAIAAKAGLDIDNSPAKALSALKTLDAAFVAWDGDLVEPLHALYLDLESTILYSYEKSSRDARAEYLRLAAGVDNKDLSNRSCIGIGLPEGHEDTVRALIRACGLRHHHAAA